MVVNSMRLPSARTAFWSLIGCALVAGPAQAYTEKVLSNFAGYPQGPVLRVDGNFYGTTYEGGDTSCNAPNGCGVVYEVDRHGHETVLHKFTGANGDGALPEGSLIRDAQGNLYGTTAAGGDNNCQCGTAYKIDSTGKLTVLHAFTDSYNLLGPSSGLVRDDSGNLFGVNFSGGDYQAGTIFKIDAQSNYTLLHSFSCAKNDGCYPNFANMILDKRGNLYGVATNGGSAGGSGVIYKFNTSTNTLKILYSFSGGADGGYPTGALLRDSAGNFYGTTFEGGSASGINGNGVAYKLSKGVLTVLYTVPAARPGNASTGPFGAGLIKDASGNLYGTTSDGGAHLRGSVFKIDPGGNETDLYSFTGGADGNSPWAAVTLDTNGDLYGTTTYGGASGGGVVFKLTP